MPGENHINAKLKDDDVRKILGAFDGGTNRDDIAAMFGVSRRCIEMIGFRETWRHITIPSGGNGDTPDV